MRRGAWGPGTSVSPDTPRCRVGLGRITRDRERLLETLDVMKWLCREFWPEVFRKSVDKLQMNNMGVFVLQVGEGKHVPRGP